jgi:3-hydroxybutyryl-CoA dehydrogenase
MTMETVRHIGVVGAGAMGSGIAQAAAMAGLDVLLLDVSTAALQKGLAMISNSLERLARKGKVSAEAQAAAFGRIRAVTELAQLAAVDVVIEAATENEAVKIRILREIENVVGAETILASNTSSISITVLAAACERPQRFIGMHFFNPVPLMALIEIIRGLQTSDATHARIEALARTLGKTPITVRNHPGFVVNRILCPMINEAIFVLAEGLASAEEIDAGMTLGCNHPLGPLALADMIGLDTLLAVMNVFYDGLNESKYRPAPLLKEMVAAGYLGRKSGRGFYRYP